MDQGGSALDMTKVDPTFLDTLVQRLLPTIRDTGEKPLRDQIHSLQTQVGKNAAAAKAASAERGWDDERTDRFMQAWGSYEAEKERYRTDGVPNYVLRAAPEDLSEAVREWREEQKARGTPAKEGEDDPLTAAVKAAMVKEGWTGKKAANLPPIGGGTTTRSNAEIMDAYIADPTPANRKAYEAIRR